MAGEYMEDYVEDMMENKVLETKVLETDIIDTAQAISSTISIGETKLEFPKDDPR